MKKAALFGDDFALGKCYDLGGCLGFDKERCRQHYQRAAEKGDAEAMFNLSRTYSMAWLSHSEPDPVLEKKYLVQAAERGHTFALILLINNSKDDAERVKWLELLAANCDGNFFEEFVYELAVRYEQGKGVSQDDHKAVKWYAKAAELGSAKSFLALARCHMSGRGVKQDEELASQLYVEAAKRNSAEAMYELALISESVDLKYEMAGWLGEAGRHGHLPSKLRYAECLEYGVGVTKDPAAAVAIYKELGSLKSDSFAFTTLEDSFSHTAGQFTEQSAEENMSICARAAYRVAMAYKNGKGVESDLAQTVKWLKKSAKLGSSEAMFTLGQYSERGEGMRKSPKIAVKWYEAAAKLDHQPAQERLKELVPKQI